MGTASMMAQPDLAPRGNGALSQCSLVEHEDDKEDEFPDAEPEAEEHVETEDESDS